MKNKYYVFIIIVVFFVSIKCEDISEPREYIHNRAGFKITCPAGWRKIVEDDEMLEFRSGDLKLVEVGGFDMEMAAVDLINLTDEGFFSLLRKFTLAGLEGYCEGARIRNCKIIEQGDTQWGGLPAYHVKANGYSDEALSSMVVDVIIIVHKGKSRMYMFAAQIAKDEYSRTKSDLEVMLTSFQFLK